MRSLLLAATCLLPSFAFAADAPPAPSSDLTMTFSAQEQAAWGQVSAVMDKCVLDAVMRSNAASCHDLAPFLDAWAAKVKAAKPVEVSTAPPKGE